MADIARKDHIDRTGEVVAVFEKERALLWKEDGESLVDRDLRLVGLDLAKVRIDGGVEHEAVVNDELGVETNLGLKGTALEKGIARITLVNVTKTAEQAVRDQLNISCG